MKKYLAVAITLAIIAGCGDKNEPKTIGAAPLAAPQSTPPMAVPPPAPPPNAVNDGIQRPTPGQAGDTSSPEFKGGGKADPKK